MEHLKANIAVKRLKVIRSRGLIFLALLTILLLSQQWSTGISFSIHMRDTFYAFPTSWGVLFLVYTGCVVFGLIAHYIFSNSSPFYKWMTTFGIIGLLTMVLYFIVVILY